MMEKKKLCALTTLPGDGNAWHSSTQIIIWSLDNNKAQCFQAIAIVMLAVQSTVTMFDELLALIRLNLKMHRVPSITAARVVGEDAFQYHDRHKSIRRKGIRSVCEREKTVSFKHFEF